MPNAFPHPALYLRDEEGESPYAPSPTPATPPAFAIDPAILREEAGQNTLEYAYTEQEEPQFEFLPPLDIYVNDPSGSPPNHPYTRDGPQGPPPEPILRSDPDDYEEPPARPVKKQRRLKRPRREAECSFCQGNDETNKDDLPERMLSCSNCGRSGHPTCLDISQIVDTVFSYPWTCIECKPCEICQAKGDDTKLLFCDNCDRGWHYDCLSPPLDGPPEGNWNCPLCPPLPEIPVASSSHSEQPQTEFDESRHSEAFQEQETAVRSSAKSKGKGKVRPRSRVNVHVPPARVPGPPAKRARAHRTDSPSTARPEARVTFRLRLSGPKGKGRERREDDDLNKSPFEGVLTPEELDTSKTYILSEDKARFERSRIAAENKLARVIPPPAIPGPSGSQLPATLSLRPLRSVAHLLPSTPQLSDVSSSTFASTSTSHPASPTPASSSATTSTPLRIRTIRFGQYDIDTWYDAPFPEEYNNTPEGRLWMCEFCLKYMKSGFGSARHLTKCKARHPPGDEIYRDGAISVFEVDGRKNKIYCQNLCLLSKMFLDHKSLFYDVEPFLFYVMTEADEGGARFVGYFSKEKRSPKDFNVSCIMTLPVRQRRGWGNLLIDFSYLLSKKEGRVGSPERPLSALGALSYRNYWTLALMTYLETAPDHVTLENISKSTSMTVQDILTTLKEQNMITVDDRLSSPLPRSPAGGKNRSRGRPHSSLSRRLAARKAPAKEDSASEPLIPTSYKIHWRKEVVDDYLTKWRAKGYLTLKPNRLKWTPYLLARIPKMEPAAPQVAAASQLPSVIPQPESTGGPSVRGDETTVNPSRSASHEAPSPSRLAQDLAQLDDVTPKGAKSRGAIENDKDDVIIDNHLRSPRRLRRDPSDVHQGPRTRTTRSQSSLRGSVTSIVDDSAHQDSVSTPIPLDQDSSTTSPPLSRTTYNGIRSMTRASLRKRRRIESSPDSSGLSEPPTTPERSLSPAPLSPVKIMNGHVHGNDNGYPIRHTRSAVTRSSSVHTSAILAHSTNGNSNGISLRGRRVSSRLNYTNQRGPFLPLLDDPEEALRLAKKARVTVPTRPPKKTHVLAIPLLKEDQLDTAEQVNFAMNGIELDFVDHVTNGTAHLTNGFASIEDDIGDLDAEGEEEILDTVNGGVEVGDEDAEGEEDLDAEGEPEP